MVQYYRTRTRELIVVYTITFDDNWLDELSMFIGNENISYMGSNNSVGVYVNNQWEILEQGNNLIKSKDGIKLSNKAIEEL